MSLTKASYAMVNGAPVNVLDYGADPTGATDSITAINNALAEAHSVYFPAGTYLITRPMNLTARRAGDNTIANGRKVFGEGVNKVIIKAETNGYAAIDLTGSSHVTLSDMWIVADQATSGGRTNASVGIVNRRGTSSAFTEYCHFNVFERLRVNMASDISLNTGNGTVGFVQYGGEHCFGYDAEIYANLPMYIGNNLDFAIPISSNIPTYGVEYEIPMGDTASPSCSVCSFTDYALIAYDAFRSLYVNQVFNVSFLDTYQSTRKVGSSFISSQKESIKIVLGAEQFIFQGSQEESGLFGTTWKMDHAYITVDGPLLHSDFKIMRGVGDYGFAEPVSPVESIRLENGAYIKSSKFNLNYSLASYAASSNVPGFATNSIFVAGTGQYAWNSEFILDNASHTPYIYNQFPNNASSCVSENFYTGANAYTPISIFGNAAYRPSLNFYADASVQWNTQLITDSSLYYYQIANPSETIGVYMTPSASGWNNISDEREKSDWNELTDALQKVSTLRAGTHKWVRDESLPQDVGLIAQELQQVLPEAVDASNPERLGIRYTHVVPLLVKAIQELKAEVDALKGN